MKRRLLNWCYHLFLLGCVLATALAIAFWARSSEQRDVARLGWERRTGADPAVGGVTACSGWECLMLSAEVLRPSDPRILQFIDPQPPVRYWQMRPGRWYPWLDRPSASMRFDRYGFIFYWQNAQPSFIPIYTGGNRVAYGPATNPSSGPGWWVKRWAIGVPHWFVVLVASPWPVMWAMQRRRLGQGLCPECGWEVWDTDLACPGCGRRTDDAPQPARPAPPPPAVAATLPGLPPRLPRPYPGYATGLRFSRRLSAWRKAF